MSNDIKNKKAIAIFFISIVFTIALSLQIYNWTTKKVYYLNKDTHEVIFDRIYTKRVGSESAIQSFLRRYLAGDTDYKAKMPFSYETRLLSASHNEKADVLVLNWNSYFYKALEQDTADLEIELLLLSLKQNFSISTVFFLVEDAVIHISWESLDLSQGIDLQNLDLEKNLKK